MAPQNEFPCSPVQKSLKRAITAKTYRPRHRQGAKHVLKVKNQEINRGFAQEIRKSNTTLYCCLSADYDAILELCLEIHPAHNLINQLEAVVRTTMYLKTPSSIRRKPSSSIKNS